MAVLPNTKTTADVLKSLDVEAARNFDSEYNQLSDLLSFFPVETVAAGTALKSYTITGKLDTTEYTEGDEVPVSKYTVSPVSIDEIVPKPYRARTTLAAVQKAGIEGAVLRTDSKMLADIRTKIVTDFIGELANGTTEATGTTVQAALANADAALADALESASYVNSGVTIHLLNRQDAYKYLGTAQVTTQTAFGLTYLEDYLGIQNVVLTNKVASGSFYVIPVDNMHIYAPDFSAMAALGYDYTVSDSGLIGVMHKPAPDHDSVDTYFKTGLTIWPEYTNFVVKGTIAPSA